MNIYVITKSYYDEHYICAVTTDKALAGKIAKKFSKSEYDEAEIEVYDSNEYNEEYLKYKIAYTISFDASGDILHCERISRENPNLSIRKKDFNGVDIETDVYANSRKDAIRIATKKRARFLSDQINHKGE